MLVINKEMMVMTIFLRDKFRSDEEIARDGEVVRTPMLIMDHRPHFVAADAASRDDACAVEARDARAAMIDRAKNAWRMDTDARKKKPPRDPDDDDDDDDGETMYVAEPGFAVDARDARASATAEYRRMCARLQDGWRTPARDATQPNLGNRPEELMRRHTRTEPDDDAQARRDKTYRDYTVALSEAWKNPPGAIRPQATKVARAPSAFVAAVESPDPAVRAAQIERLGEQTRGGR
jgi:hypothetical protein